VNCTRRPQAFTPGRIKVLSIFTSAAATGIEASRLYAEQRRTDARYREVLQMAADAIISLDSEFRIILFNSAAERIFGWTTAEVLGKPLDVLIPDHLAETYRREFEAFDRAPAATIPRQGRGPFSARRKDGTEFRVEVSVSRLESDDKCIYTAVLRDITQRLAQEERIMRLSRIQAVLSGINSAIVRIRDRDALFREACRIAVEEGMFRMAWIGVAEPDLSRVRPVASMGIVDGYLEVIGRALEAAGLDEGAGGRALRGQQPVVFNDVENDPGVAFRKEALARGYRSLAVLPLVVNRAPAGLLALYAAEPHSFDSEEMKLLRELSGDISFALEVMEKEAQLNYVAHYDVLTGLPNRALFEERLDQRIRAARRGGRIFAVVLLDLERFRNVNQTLGRNVGDSVLRQFGQRLSEAIGETGSLAHVGADDFAIATRECNDETDVARTIEHILAASLGSPFDGGGTELRLAARAGIALHPADGIDAESLWHNAEAALRESARSGEKYQFYAPHLNASVAQTLRLENRLRGALERSEFVLHYQPKIDLETGRIAGLEALIRWQDPETGLVPPGQFIPLLEETGLIVPVGNWAMREAVGAAATLRARGFGSVRIAVNVSALQLQRKDFVQDVETVIAGARAQPQLLDLEITESAIMHDIAENVRKLGDVRSLGVELAIDDFGTGYSSLSYIARLPVDVLKIDRAFIKNLEEDTDSMSIVQTIVSLAHMLECRVVAEGVETEGQAAILRQLQCEQCQGFLFSKPVALPEIERMLGRSAAT
jgi:PAS domain S-box-containing protein/diguanylate cyclase (GGDEF)-like protein